MAGLKPSFSVDFSVNEGYFVSNMVVIKVIFAIGEITIVKQLKFVKQPVVKKSLFLFAKINFNQKRFLVYYELSLTNIDFTGIIHTKECDFYVYYFERRYLESVNCI